MNEKLKEFHKQMEGKTTLDENGVLWRFTNGKWHAGCVLKLLEPRYKKLNDFYLLDTYTGLKIDQNKALELLNNYEEALNVQTRHDSNK